MSQSLVVNCSVQIKIQEMQFSEFMFDTLSFRNPALTLMDDEARNEENKSYSKENRRKSII